MAIARIYQNGQWVPVNQGSPELVSHDYLERELSFKADFDHNHDDKYLPQYYAQIYLDNSGSPTHTSISNWQKVGGGGGTGTLVAAYDVRPPGIGAQVDTATNKRIDIRKTGVYRISFAVSFGITSGKVMYGSVYKNGAQFAAAGHAAASTVTAVGAKTFDTLLTSGDYLELYAFQTESAATAYDTFVASRNFIAIQYIGPSS